VRRLDQPKVLPKKFYERSPEKVAKELLGKILIRKLEDKTLSGIIVETEAYFGPDDPASRAFQGIKNYNSPMWGEPGRTFIYNVHKYWMLNIVAHKPGGVGAVLIRAIEPMEGIDIMKRNRGISDDRRMVELTNGPGKLTVALGIDKGLNGIRLTSKESPIRIVDSQIHVRVSSSKRIGVRADLDRDLRFYIEGNKFVSRA